MKKIIKTNFFTIIIGIAFIFTLLTCDLFNDNTNDHSEDNTTIFPYGLQYATPGKSQLGLGLCWLFADNAVLETHIKKTTGNEVSLSENHARFGIFGSRFGLIAANFSAGGNTSMTTTYWLRGEHGGPVLTQNDSPYADNLNATTPIWNENAPRYGRVTGVQWLPDSQLESTKDLPGYDPVFRNNIKEAITNYGSVAASMYSDTSRLNNSPDGVSYYHNHPDSYNNVNHIIQILGWNDNYPAEKFTNPPPGKGAWYVKNSTTGAKEHFHWVSYYQYIQTVRFVTGFNPTPVGNVYDYTPQTRLTQSWAPGGKTRFWANIFDCEEENAYLEEIIIRVRENTSYNIYVAAGEITNNAEEDSILLNSSFSNKVAELKIDKNEENKYPGYYTLKLPTPILVGNKSFAIVIEGTSLDENNVRVFYVLSSEEENFSSNLRESYISGSTGVNKTWSDWHSQRNGNFYIYGVVSGSEGKSDRRRIADR